MWRVMFTCRAGPEQERGDFTTESFFLFSDHSGRACDWAVTNSDILLIIPSHFLQQVIQYGQQL